MARAMRPCLEDGCPTPVPRGTSRCRDHARARDKARGTAQQRGYGTTYQRLRRALAPIVAAGRATCWRCGTPIGTGQPWDLGHHDTDRTIIQGPEHQHCNRSAAGRAAHD